MHAYQKGPLIGEGTYGSVICATHKATGRQVAIKKVRLSSSSGKDGVNMSVLRELKALRALAAPCIVDLLDTFSTKSSLVLVFEFMEWSLEDVIRDKGQALSEADVKGYMQMVLQALAHVHSHQAIHRDIKPDNLLISSDGHLKLADFGLARFLSSPTDSPTDDAPGKLTPQVFGRWYRPPELLMGSSSYGYGVDMWAAGCVFAELLLRKPWFPGNCDMDQLDRIFKMLGVPTPEVWPGYADLPHRIDFKPAAGQPLQQVFQQASPEALDLLKRLMAFDPERRISAAQALAHPYFSAQPQPTPPGQLPKPASTRLNRLGLSRVPAVIPDMLMPHRLLQQQQQGFAVAGIAAAGWADAGEAGEALLMQQQRQQDVQQQGLGAAGRSGLGARAGGAAAAAAAAARPGQLGGNTSRLLAFSDAPSFSGRFLGQGLLPAEQQQQHLQQQQQAGGQQQQPAGGQRHSVHFAADVAEGDGEQEGAWKGRLSFSGILDEPTPPAAGSSNPSAAATAAPAPAAPAAGDENALPASAALQQQLQQHTNRRSSPAGGQAHKGAAAGQQQPQHQTASSNLRPPLHPNATPVHARTGQHTQGAGIGSGDDRTMQQQGSRQRRGVSDLSAALSNAAPSGTAGGGSSLLLNPLAPLLGMQRAGGHQQGHPSLLDSLGQQAAGAGALPAHASTPAGPIAGGASAAEAEGDTVCPMSLNTSARKRTRTVFEAAPADTAGGQQQQGQQDDGDVSMATSNERRVVRGRRSSIHSGCCSMETDTMDGAAAPAPDAHQQQQQQGAQYRMLGAEDRSMSITSSALPAAMAGTQQPHQQQQQGPPQHMQREQQPQHTAEMPPPHVVQPKAAAVAAAASAGAAAGAAATDPATSSKAVLPGSGGSTCPMSLDHRVPTGQHHQQLQQQPVPGPGSSGQLQQPPQPPQGSAGAQAAVNSGDLVTGGRPPAGELRSMDPAELAELAKFWRPRLDSAERRYLRCRTMQLGEALLQASQPDDDELGPEYHRFPGMDSSPSGCRGLFDTPTPAKGHTQAGQHQQQEPAQEQPQQQQHAAWGQQVQQPTQQPGGGGADGGLVSRSTFLSPPDVAGSSGQQQLGPAAGVVAGPIAAGVQAGTAGLLPVEPQHDASAAAAVAAAAAPAPVTAAR